MLRLLEPLSTAVLDSLRGCVRKLCLQFFPDEEVALDVALNSVELLAAHPLRSLLAKGTKAESIETNALADCFRKALKNALADCPQAAALRDNLIWAAKAVLDEVVKRVERRIKAFILHVFWTSRGKQSVMQQIALQFLREIATLPDEGEGVHHAKQELIKAKRFLAAWRNKALRLLDAQRREQASIDELHEQEIFDSIVRRTIESGQHSPSAHGRSCSEMPCPRSFLTPPLLMPCCCSQICSAIFYGRARALPRACMT